MTPTAVLIVEDEKIIAKGIEKQLKAMGYAVAGSAATGEEAVRKAIALRPDLILMDISLGAGIDGVEAAGQIRGQLNVPVVYLTANSDAATLQRAKLTDLFGYVLKPYEDKDLQTAIEIALYRHKMERQLRENKQWLAATLGSIGDGVIAIDGAGRVRFMNAHAEVLTGWAQADAAGRPVQDIFNIFHERTLELVRNPALDALANGKPATLARDTILIDKAGKERPIDDSASPIRDVDGNISGAVLVFRDISERRRLEDHLRQAQKMEAIGRLAGGIAHDFNNILTIIAGYSEFLLFADLSPEEHLAAAREIHAAAQRAAGLTQQILAFSRKQMLVPCVLNLNTVVRDMGTMVKRLIGSNIEFVTDLLPGLGNVKADPTQIGQVLLNLAANARDAMRRGGRFVLATSHAELSAADTRLPPDVPPGRYVVLSVSDTGVGMPEAMLANIFEPFFTTKGVGQGTGLGLATVFGVVKQSGGHITVTSKVAEGTCFRVYLPVVEEAPPAPASVPRPAAKGRETILLVEDDDVIRRMTKQALQQSGYTVLDAADGEDGLAVAAAAAGPIHLLLTDLVMPKVSGRELADRLSARMPAVRVLFVSGYTEDEIVHHGVETAAVDFLHKPFSLAALADKVREILDRP